jgi:mannitol 2-dehydrogenase
LDELIRDIPMIALSQENLPNLPAGIARPNYDRTALRAGIVHIGLGNFHRAHQAWYLHQLMQQGLARDWAIIGAGVRPYDAVQRQKLLAQDCLTSLIKLDPKGVSVEIVGSMIDYIPVVQGNGPLIARIAEPDIRIVALTVTEGGYYIDPVTQGFDATDADILHDVANPDCPKTAFGAIVAALNARRLAGHGPLTLQSCDNLQGNGAVLRQTVVSLARLIDLDLAAWIDRACSFPNSMVDCIVPATGASALALAKSFGLHDHVPVTHEAFRQWVMEDDFCAGRPDWDRAGATFSEQVHEFEAMKIRILNGGHQVLANAGEVLSLATIASAIGDADIAPFFSKVVREEIAPHMRPVSAMTPADYVTLIERRFANEMIIDTTRRVAFDGSSRHPGFVLPSLRDGLAKGTSISGLALVEAAWARMCAAIREDGSVIEANDPYWNALRDTALAAKSNPKAWLSMSRIYGDLNTEPRFVSVFGDWLNMIWADGLRSALARYVEHDFVVR